MIELIEKNRQEIQEICERNHVDALYFFGSITTPEKFREDSDIDILVSFTLDETNPEEYTASYFQLLFSLEDLLGREIDITTTRSVKNPFFLEELNKTKVLFFDSLAPING